ncbi:hypothetical protein LES9216_00469 [Leuconostoc suionicum]|uniref:Uncharacterized protein n=1 Tax=Leuconostoc suionicum TaxID=1511761 RepID=A0A2N9K862_9LACO|nr:hypothetical protein LES8486_00322 [Leuconostoc suionicum]SPE06570.1 hypothetical protein LES9216_00469 [Leuconostoc suionicum]SPH03077.1 hypothetical protein LES8484_00322 [Leuconostoc suionicum]
MVSNILESHQLISKAYYAGLKIHLQHDLDVATSGYIHVDGEDITDENNDIYSIQAEMEWFFNILICSQI